MPFKTTDRAAVTTTARYAKCIEVSKRIRWDIDRDVIRGRGFDFTKKFMPDGLSKVQDLTFLSPHEKRFLSQIQGRTYANIFGLVERYIGAKTLELSRDHTLGDQVALEALVRMTDEELKHQELFRRLERMAGEQMPEGYEFKPQPNDVAGAVLSKSTWAVLALTLDIEIFTQVHYRSSIETDTELSDLWKDVFLFHWKEESQHAILDELEWRREHARLNEAERDQECHRPDRTGRRGRRHRAAAGESRCRLLHLLWRSHVRLRRTAGDPRHAAASLPLAVHRQRRAGATLRRSAD